MSSKIRSNSKTCNRLVAVLYARTKDGSIVWETLDEPDRIDGLTAAYTIALPDGVSRINLYDYDVDDPQLFHFAGNSPGFNVSRYLSGHGTATLRKLCKAAEDDCEEESITAIEATLFSLERK